MSSTLGLQELLKTGFNDSIVAVSETAPYTTIQNRAKVTRSLKAVAGVERIMVRSANKLNTEYGPNGESVYEADNKDARIRFVGSGWAGSTSTNGTRATSGTVGDYVEITFYGTGLNFITWIGSGTGTVVVSIDGGADGSGIFPTASSVLAARNYSTNQIINIAGSPIPLTLGWHTVRIKLTVLAGGLDVYGFEVLNQRTDLAVYSGTGIADGKAVGLSALTSSTFKDGIVGTRGGRVVKYIDGSELKSAAQEVDSSSKYLTLADHTNEEIARRISTLEFGAGRSDDFSTTSASKAAAFTLDDGTTTLVADAIINNNALSGISNVAANFFTLTFVGTGLDIIGADTATGSIDSTSISVDGGSTQLLYGPTSTTAASKIIKVVSGLPYGTHTIKFSRSAAGTARTFWSDFIIYQPKKPSIPDGCLEVADHCVMADYVASSSASAGSVGSGVMRKMATRENTYAGTFAITSDSTFECGFNINSATATNYTEYTFFGTGIVFSGSNAAATLNGTVTIDGSSNLSSFTTSFVQTLSGATFTASTGALGGTSTTNNRWKASISGLTLGKHTIRITLNAASTIYFDCFDVITPIHINSSDLKTGSLSLKSYDKITSSTVNNTKWQKKVLAADITAAGGATSTIPSLCFNNLVIGATYRITLSLRATWQNGVTYNDSLSLQAINGNALLLNITNNRYASSSYGEEFGAGQSVCFVATSTSLTIQWVTGSTSGTAMYIRGGSDYYTFSMLEQLPNHQQTYEW